MIRPLISTLLQRLTTDTGALRERIAELEDEVETMRSVAGKFKAEADIICRAHRGVVEERDRLRVMAGNTEPTASERLMLGIVRDMPGASAYDYGRAFAKVDPEYPTENPHKAIIDNHAKHLSSLHKKGLVRREKAGQSYRYWPSDG